MTGPGSARGCPLCGGRVSASAAFCGSCGLRLAPPAPVRRSSARPRTILLALFGAIAIAVVIVGAGIGLLLQPKDRAGDGTAAGASVGPAASGSTVTGPPVALATPFVVDGAEDPTILVPVVPDELDTPPVDETRPPTVRLTVGVPSDLAAQTIGASGGTLEAEGLQASSSRRARLPATRRSR